MAESAVIMKSACHHLHEIIANWPRFKAGYDSKSIPENGLYFLFEKGEHAHGYERIVRVGTHTGQNNLAKRLGEHLYTPNKDRSIFRKHIGRCLLSRQADPFQKFWELDLTTKKQREISSHLVDPLQLAKTEEIVSKYINENFSFCILPELDKAKRLKEESSILTTIAQCPECKASSKWLGNHHPNPAIKKFGLWNVQGLNKTPLDLEDIQEILSAGDR